MNVLMSIDDENDDDDDDITFGLPPLKRKAVNTSSSSASSSSHPHSYNEKADLDSRISRKKASEYNEVTTSINIARTNFYYGT